MEFKKKLAIGAGVVATATVAMHVFNKCVHIAATQDRSLDNIPDLYYNWKLGEISYTKHGKGKPILLVHDLTTYSSSYEWSRIVERLAETNTVYCIDLLGCGSSDKPNLTYTNFLYVQLLTDFIKNVIGDKVDVVVTGESSSFVIATANMERTLIKKIIMVNPTDLNVVTKAPGKVTKMFTKIINTPILGTFLYNIFTRKSKVRDMVGEDDAELAKVYYEAAHSNHPGSKYLFASLAGFYTTLNVKHCLGALNNNISIIVGNRFEEYEEIAEEYQEILPTIDIFKFDGVHYLPQLEQAEDFVEKLIDIIYSI